ncbi:hypothetical protein BN961_02130 [Afipia felis]|uniref:Uncharacterized protein n=1 Tax=Afipia felis TaxID=1035 RepID=A0A090MR43_AFIFE|nr:hypothetical protein [Afipia felis]CEG08712.1 hypothetical protein BN961_02130 [Afipia felis]
MTLTLNGSATNNADWKTQFVFTDGETGTPIDFTGAYIEIEVKDQDRCKRIEASTSNGMIVIQDVGTFELTIPADSMKCLCPSSYLIGGLYQLNGGTISLFTGTLSIIDGVARA